MSIYEFLKLAAAPGTPQQQAMMAAAQMATPPGQRLVQTPVQPPPPEVEPPPPVEDRSKELFSSQQQQLQTERELNEERIRNRELESELKLQTERAKAEAQIQEAKARAEHDLIKQQYELENEKGLFENSVMNKLEQLSNKSDNLKTEAGYLEALSNAGEDTAKRDVQITSLKERLGNMQALRKLASYNYGKTGELIDPSAAMYTPDLYRNVLLNRSGYTTDVGTSMNPLDRTGFGRIVQTVAPFISALTGINLLGNTTAGSGRDSVAKPDRRPLQHAGSSYYDYSINPRYDSPYNSILNNHR